MSTYSRTRPCTWCTVLLGKPDECEHPVTLFPAHVVSPQRRTDHLIEWDLDPALHELVWVAFYPDGRVSPESEHRLRRAVDLDPGGKDFDDINRGLPHREYPIGRSAAWWAAAVAGSCGDLAGLEDLRKLTLQKKTYRLGMEAADPGHLKACARDLLDACEANGLIDDAGRRYCVSVIRRGLRKGWVDAERKEAAGIPARRFDREHRNTDLGPRSA